MTEQEKIQELLKPRFKVIADYPGSDFEIGNILTKAVNLYEFEIEPGRIRNYSDHMIESYPHLFKRLEWHEDRKPVEMPEFVKDKFNQVHKVTSVERIGANLEKGFYAHWENVQPATIIEYTEYQNNRNEREA